MKIIIVLTLLSTICGYLADDTEDTQCCPNDKETWCEISCYKCSAEEEQAMADEDVEFQAFMDELYRLDAVNKPMPFMNCTSGEPVESVLIYPMDNWKIRDSMYGASITTYRKCMNCKTNPTPLKFSKCSIKLRKQNQAGLYAVRLQIDNYLKKEIKKHEKICKNLPSN